MGTSYWRWVVRFLIHGLFPIFPLFSISLFSSCFRIWADNLTMAKCWCRLRRIMKQIIKIETPKLMEDRFRWKLKVLRVLLIKESWTSWWLLTSLETLLLTLRSGKLNSTETWSMERIPRSSLNMWTLRKCRADLNTSHMGLWIQVSQIPTNKKQCATNSHKMSPKSTNRAFLMMVEVEVTC
jgi:hypothetical protein